MCRVSFVNLTRFDETTVLRWRGRSRLPPAVGNGSVGCRDQRLPGLCGSVDAELKEAGAEFFFRCGFGLDGALHSVVE